MGIVDRIASAISSNTGLAIVGMLMVLAAVGAGAPMVESVSSLDQFQSDSPEADKLDYIENNFGGQDNTTTAQVVVRNDNVLSRDSLISTLEYQQELEGTEVVNRTLTGERPTFSVANAVATATERQEQVREIQAELEAEQQQLEENRTALEAEQQQLQQREADLNETVALLEQGLNAIQENPDTTARIQYENVRAEAPVSLSEAQFDTFQQAANQLRAAESQAEIEAAYELGTEGVLQNEFETLQQQADELESRGEELEARANDLEARAAALESGELLQNTRLTLSEQITRLENVEDDELDGAIEAVLNSTRGGGTGGPIALMPTDYDRGSGSADATIVIVTQEQELDTNAEGAAGPRTIDSQLEMRSIGEQTDGVNEYQVFGAGIIAHEIDASMADSLIIVGPLALLFVLVALTVAYRDLLDIVLGVFGIGAVLTMTFGFMGWAGINFGQVFVAVPVLLIGLSIDYAIHIFMRHREQRDEEPDIRKAMGVALGGVGAALVFVTATTAIGFLSNLTSPVPPIQDFGVVSAVGIVAALLIFGILIPALKTEIDERLEARGIDRQKRAFGTGGGRFSKALSVGATAAQRAPIVILLVVLLIGAAGAYGGTQVETSFDQQDFLADDPPDWMKDLPEPFAPDTYTANSSLTYVNERFIRNDANAEILIEGAVTEDNTLQRLDSAKADATEQPATLQLSSGEAAIDSPLNTMRSVADRSDQFNATFTAADTDGDGVPDQNVEGVYDELFAVAPDQANQFIDRSEDGEYRALRMTVAVKGTSSAQDVTDQMQSVAANMNGDGLEVTATGGIVLNTIVQQQLLDTVLESLIITLVVVFIFLMIAYRVTDGSFTLGAVTLFPVALASAWIVGSMFLLGIPFNILTGMILSLTIGLGVAYSIHVSERYTLELDRQRAVWPAMDTAVTGTGGALLGSAATTIGGFGVLMFAILPPLQQFGLITAMSILYAFVGSVFVLPSLLALWTKYAGPDWARSQLSGDAGTGEEDSDEETAVAAGDGAVPASPTGSEPSATRELDVEHARPGQLVTVDVTVTGPSDRTALRETLAGASLSIEGISPKPVQAVELGDTVYVAWDTIDETAQLQYATTIPETVSDGESVQFDGAVLTENGDLSVDGASTVAVVTDLSDLLDTHGYVSDGDLQAASDYLRAGTITRDEFEHVYRTWLSENGRQTDQE